MKTEQNYHNPVLCFEAIESLNINPDGIYVDATFGGGGHASQILGRLNNGKLLAFDQDKAARNNVPMNEQLIFVNENFKWLEKYLRVYNIQKVDGIIADLGVSSHQLDTPERGFSFRFSAPLDMRMNAESPTCAADIINTYSAEALQNIFSQYGEIRNSKTLATIIVAARNSNPIKDISVFLNLIQPAVKGLQHKYLAQVFQALRIEVNQEMEVLQSFLKQALNVLKSGGRLVVLSYHSLEDRMVKNFMKTGDFEGRVQKDEFGVIHKPFHVMSKKPIPASQNEIKNNPRSRSVKMRVAEKI